jgi:uncharacterized protein
MNTHLKTIWLAGLLAALTACAGAPRPEPTRLLLGYDGPTPAANVATGRTLVVRAVSMPDYLDRRDIVYRNGAVVGQFADAVWAERPGKSITRYLAQALASLRSDYAVQALTTASGVAPDAALSIVIDRFEADGGAAVQLRAGWTLTAPGKTLAAGRLQADVPLSAATAAATVAAMQKALSIAAADLAQTLPRVAAVADKSP